MPRADPILTAAQMRAAEARAAPDAESLYALMERAGAGVADVVWRLSAGAEILIVCGPGNNGGDGYVAARLLRERGASVHIWAPYPPATELAVRAAAGWFGHEAENDASQSRNAPEDCNNDADLNCNDGCTDEKGYWGFAPIVVDAMFGTGALRPLDPGTMLHFRDLAEHARRVIAIDLPSGLDADHGFFHVDPMVEPVRPDLTLALGALKAAHIMANAVVNCGDVRLIDLGLDLGQCPTRTIARPVPPALKSDSHKYSRGMVGVISGEMPGAALLAATAAAYAGAGYVALYGGNEGGPACLVHRLLSEDSLRDERLGAVVIGPGLGRGSDARRWVEFLVNETRHDLVIDADALHLVDFSALPIRMGATILTPHAGELHAMRKRAGISFREDLTVVEQAIADLEDLGLGGNTVLVCKGATTYLSQREQVCVAPRGSAWLSTAGTGDVLAGAIATMLALYGGNGRSWLDAAAAGVWLHSDAARRLGQSFIADDLARELQKARASL